MTDFLALIATHLPECLLYLSGVLFVVGVAGLFTVVMNGIGLDELERDA